MKRKNLIIPLIFLAVTVSSWDTGYEKVKYIYDGDTILLNNNIKVRYIGIDSPEIDHNGLRHEYMALQSRNMNISLLHNRQIRIVPGTEKRDRHNRLLAYVFHENGEMINSILLKHGLAWVMTTPPNLKYLPLFIESQRYAITEKLGIWQRPFKYSAKSYAGNRKSYRFHSPDCRFGKSITPGNRVLFKTVQEAFWEGFSPCRECLTGKDLFNEN